MEAEKIHTKQHDWTYQKNVRGQLTSSICTSGYDSAGMSLWPKHQT